MTVGLKFLLGGIKPLLEASFIEDGGNHRCRDLVGCGLAPVICKNRTDEPHRVGSSLIPDCCGIGRRTCEDVFRRDVSEGFRSILELHRVPLLGAEIDRDLARDQLPTGDLAKSPAAMRAECPRREIGEGFGGGGGDFTGVDVGI